MPALAQPYNPSEHEPTTSFDPVPAGRYGFMIMGTSIEHPKDAVMLGDGFYDRFQLALECEIQGGPHDGRKFWDRIWARHTSQKAQEFGDRRRSALNHSIGYLQSYTNSDVLHGRTGTVDLDIEAAGRDEKTGKTYAAKNVVKNYVLPGDVTKTPAPSTTAAPAAQAGGARMVTDKQTGKQRPAKGPWDHG